MHPPSSLPGALPVRSGSGNLGSSVVAVWRSPAYISSISTSYCRGAVLLGPVVHVPSQAGVPTFVCVGEGVVVVGAVGVLGAGGVSAVEVCVEVEVEVDLPPLKPDCAKWTTLGAQDHRIATTICRL